MTNSHYAFISSCLVSNPYAIILMIALTHVSLSQHKIAFTIKTVLGKIGDWYQAYYTTYTMVTHHRGAGCPLNRGLDILTEDTEHANIDNDNDSTHSWMPQLP